MRVSPVRSCERPKFLRSRIEEDNHAYVYVAQTLGGGALLDSHLPMLGLIENGTTRS
ncbi:hypothetical protein ACFYMW_09915 [Streptomyces sp. NPDC006692]|uniref:hypothetical protein n=1 Tax=Streptomyces sp. NPDC006692 TaxID=3364758 RepID=UPI0036D0F5BE